MMTPEDRAGGTRTRPPSRLQGSDPVRLGPCRNRASISGHGALTANGSLAERFGKVASQVTLQEAQHSAHLVTLALLASLSAALGDLHRVSARLNVNADPGYPQNTAK